VRALLRRLDPDHSSTIGKEEIRQCFEGLGLCLVDKEVETLWDHMNGWSLVTFPAASASDRLHSASQVSEVGILSLVFEESDPSTRVYPPVPPPTIRFRPRGPAPRTRCNFPSRQQQWHR
jgi:hypothetical protein